MEAIARAHAELDRMLDLMKVKSAAQGHPVTCGAKCAACCSEPVHVEQQEVVHMLEGLSEEERAVIKVKTARWLKHIRATRLLEAELPHVIAYREAKLVCPFLKDSLCSVYERRPAACRLHNVIGNPRNCFSDKTRLRQTFVSVEAITARGLEALVENLFMDKVTRVLMFDHLGCILAALLLGDPVSESKAKQGATLEE